MKTLAFAAILFATTSNAVLADEPYPHVYENGGYFEVRQVTAAASQEGAPYMHEYLNGGHFEGEAVPLAAAAPLPPKFRTATLNEATVNSAAASTLR